MLFLSHSAPHLAHPPRRPRVAALPEPASPKACQAGAGSWGRGRERCGALEEASGGWFVERGQPHQPALSAAGRHSPPNTPCGLMSPPWAIAQMDVYGTPHVHAHADGKAALASGPTAPANARWLECTRTADCFWPSTRCCKRADEEFKRLLHLGTWTVASSDQSRRPTRHLRSMSAAPTRRHEMDDLMAVVDDDDGSGFIT